MANTHETTEPQTTGTRSGKELAMIVGVLLMAVAGTLVTYGIRSRSTEEASTRPGAVATAPAEAPTAPQRAHSVPSDPLVGNQRGRRCPSERGRDENGRAHA